MRSILVHFPAPSVCLHLNCLLSRPYISHAHFLQQNVTPCHGSGGYLLPSHRGGPGSIPGLCGICGGQLAVYQVSVKYFGLPLKVSFHHRTYSFICHRLYIISEIASLIKSDTYKQNVWLSYSPPRHVTECRRQHKWNKSYEDRCQHQRK